MNVRVLVLSATVVVAACLASMLVVVAARGGDDGPSAGPAPAPAPAAQFPPSRLATASGEPLEEDWGASAAQCGECHTVQYEDWRGSIHNRAHEDGLYHAFALLARKEDPALYVFCSACHAPAAVASGEIPGGKGREETFHTEEGVTCVVCHAAKSMREVHAGGGANASLVLEAGDVMFGPLADPAKTTFHGSEHSPLHTKAEFCSNCHSLLHPTNGLVIEDTFKEWREGPYAAAGVQCQDCHMRTVAQSVEVAEKMKPLLVPGRTTKSPEERPNVYSHTFVGGSVNAAVNGTRDFHAAEAERRLQSAATVALKLPERAAPGATASVEVAVTNRSAGHAIPTSITELRQVWIDLRATDASGREVFRSGAIDDAGRVDPKAVMYHSVLADAAGVVTYLPWRAVKMVSEKLIPPKATVRERYDVAIPKDAKGPLAFTATLRYRSAPQEVLDALFGKGKLPIRAVDMASAQGALAVE